MPLESSDNNIPASDSEKIVEPIEESSQVKGKEKDAEKWVESVDYAYEYVPVVQRLEGRKNM